MSKCWHIFRVRIGIATDAMYHCHPLYKCRRCGEEFVAWNKTCCTEKEPRNG